MNTIQSLLTGQLDIWTTAETEKKSGRGRSGGNGASVYGIKKLRELILELAVRGKLVPQDPNDEPAGELLKRIQTEKAKLIAEGKIKKGKPLPPISDEEKPFELPQGWEWVRFGDFVFSILSGGTPSKNNLEFWNGDIPWASVKDLNVEKFLKKTQDYITKEGLESGSKLANKGDLLICTRMGLGKIAIAAIDVAINQDLKALKITSFLNIDYFINFYNTLKITGSGMTVAGIKQDELLGYLVPTPPLAEQHRMVAKVDELMALCDQLETQHNNAAEAHEKLVSHLLGTLIPSQNANDFSANWQRIAAHFDTLFTTETSIDALKQTLLQLAVMGKLVPQDPNDEPASELLKRIQAEKAKLVAEGKIKKDKPLSPISDEEKPFELPQGWEWTRMTEICRPISSGSTPSAENFRYEGGVPFLKVYNIRNQSIDFDYKRQFVEESIHLSKLKRSIIYPGDVVMNIVGPPLGKVAIIPDSYPEWNCNQAIVFFGLIKPISPQYILIFLKEGSFLKGIELIGTAGQDNISVTKSQNIPIPIPPIEEQHRIVTKVDELMVLCDQLKSRIMQASQLQQKLADVIVEQAIV